MNDNDPRCAGRADRMPFDKCSERASCLRFIVFERERMDPRPVGSTPRAYTLPRVGAKNPCWFRIAVAPETFQKTEQLLSAGHEAARKKGSTDC
jgi:hypothetical protein